MLLLCGVVWVTCATKGCDLLWYVSSVCCLWVEGSCDSLYPDQYSNTGRWNTKLEGLTTEQRRSLLSFRLLKKMTFKKNKVHEICD